MNTLYFDENGYVQPYDLVEASLQTMEEYLVFSHTRAVLFNSFKQLIRDLEAELVEVTEIWVDGSFATLKANPNDIDIVCFVEYSFYENNQSLLKDLKSRYASLDLYFVRTYPENHEKQFLTKFDRLDWLHFFTKDRLNRTKGILKLIIKP